MRRQPDEDARERPDGHRAQGVGGGGAGRRARPGVLPVADLAEADRAHAAHHEPGRRHRLPRLRVARPGSRAPARQRVLRERRQAHQRRGDVAAGDRRVLRRAPGLRAGRALRQVAQPAGPAHRADGQAPRLRPLRADRLDRRLRPDGRRAALARLPRRGGVLHLRARQQRGRVHPGTLRPGLRDQQPARLQQHVPRVQRLRAARDPRHRQGHREPARHGARRPDLRRRPEPGHQPPAPALGARGGQAARGPDRGGQPAARGGAAPLQEPAEAARGHRLRCGDRRPLPADPARRATSPCSRGSTGCCWRPRTRRRGRCSTAPSSSRARAASTSSPPTSGPSTSTR